MVAVSLQQQNVRHLMSSTLYDERRLSDKRRNARVSFMYDVLTGSVNTPRLSEFFDSCRNVPNYSYSLCHVNMFRIPTHRTTVILYCFVSQIANFVNFRNRLTNKCFQIKFEFPFSISATTMSSSECNFNILTKQISVNTSKHLYR